MRNGLSGERVVGLVSQAGHYSNQTLAGWLGIGTRNLITIPTDRNLALRLDLLEQQLDELYRDGVKVAFLVATFVTTDASGIDDVAGIHAILNRKAEQHGVVRPHLHVDAAVGWALCFLTDYDTSTNEFQLNEELLPDLRRVQHLARGLQLADSVTMDFHKMGRGHYPSSAFLVNHRADLKYLARRVEDMPYFAEAQNRRDPALVTLECSRPALGPYAVMASLNSIGMSGWQMLTARTLELSHYLKKRLSELDYCQVLNMGTCGPGVVWWVLPQGRDARAIFAKLEAGELSAEEIQRYCAEVRRLFNKRNYSLDPHQDARLSFTSSIGYCPHGIDLPAWKAVFFNPKTDEAVIDRLIDSIMEL
jgi:glutamate/tyrosine decarboxylase-like PLP-dependent enzyme